MQKGLERCCRGLIYKVMLLKKKKGGKRAAPNHRSGGKKANIPGVESWGANSG